MILIFYHKGICIHFFFSFFQNLLTVKKSLMVLVDSVRFSRVHTFFYFIQNHETEAFTSPLTRFCNLQKKKTNYLILFIQCNKIMNIVSRKFMTFKWVEWHFDVKIVKVRQNDKDLICIFECIQYHLLFIVFLWNY